MKAKARTNSVADERRQTEAAKISRLRALRLAKEAAVKEAARDAANSATKPAKRRLRRAPQRAQAGSL